MENFEIYKENGNEHIIIRRKSKNLAKDITCRWKKRFNSLYFNGSQNRKLKNEDD